MRGCCINSPDEYTFQFVNKWSILGTNRGLNRIMGTFVRQRIKTEWTGQLTKHGNQVMKFKSKNIRSVSAPGNYKSFIFTE